MVPQVVPPTSGCKYAHANFGGKTRHQFVTKTWSFRGIFAMVRIEKAKQAKGFSFLTTQLTRWKSAIRAIGTILSALQALAGVGAGVGAAREEKMAPVSCKRHQIGHLDFRPRQLLTEGLLVRI